MLSRVADSLYWMSRYIERAEHTARVMAVKLESMIEQTPEEYEHTRANPMLVDLYFKSLVRARVEEWLTLADERLGSGGPPILVAPGCGAVPAEEAGGGFVWLAMFFL